MAPQFNNMNELTNYLDNMEKRVQTLESQNENLRQSLEEVEQTTTTELPRTALLSHRYFKRAFAVWGHYFVASFTIFLIVSVVFLILAAVLFVAGLIPMITPYINQLLGR